MGGKRPKRSATTYDSTLAEIADVIGTARRQTARAVNSMMTASYWAIGRRIVEVEQRGGRRAGCGEVERRASDLTARFGRGFGRSNLWQIRAFYLAYPNTLQAASGESAHRLTTRFSRHCLENQPRSFEVSSPDCRCRGRTAL
jgi:hypothetical protein